MWVYKTSHSCNGAPPWVPIRDINMLSTLAFVAAQATGSYIIPSASQQQTSELTNPGKVPPFTDLVGQPNLRRECHPRLHLIVL